MAKQTNGNGNGNGNGTALVPINMEAYPALVGGADVLGTIRFNMGGESVTPADLNRIKVPSGGVTLWTFTDAIGEEQNVKALDGVLVHIARRRAYWSSTDPTGDPPDCSSSDCQFGVGTPGGDCAKCPLNQFGSGRKSNGEAARGKACKETKLLFLLREGSMLPDVVCVPPGSLGVLRQFQLKLGVPYWSVMTRLELVKAQSRDGIGFSQLAPKKVGVLPADAAKAILGYAQALQSVFAATEFEAEEAGATVEV